MNEPNTLFRGVILVTCLAALLCAVHVLCLKSEARVSEARTCHP
jgi:hypothetical protein